MTLSVEMAVIRAKEILAESRVTTAIVNHVLSHLDPKYGGLSSVVPSLATSISHHGEFRSKISAFCLDGEHFAPESVDPVDISYWPMSRKRWLLEGNLRDSFSRSISDASCIHTHGLWEQSAVIACDTARRLSRPYLLSAHGMLETWALKNKRLKKLIYSALIEKRNVKRATCLHALTQAEARNYIDYGSRSPIAIIPNAVDIPEDISASRFLDAFPGVSGKRIVLFVGRLHKKKGIQVLVESWASIVGQHKDAHLVLAGPDSDGTRADTEERIHQLGIERSVTLTGMLDCGMKWSAMRAAEIFVLTSYSEGLSMSILEAMGSGLPVIISDACNMPEVSTHGAGWLVAPNSSAITRALHEALENTEQQNAAIGLNGEALVRLKFSWCAVSAQFTSVYKFLLGGDTPSNLEMVVPPR